MKFGICDLAKHLKKAMDVVKDKLVDKSKDLADGAIDFMGEFVDGVKIFGCPSRPSLADEIHRSELGGKVRMIDLGP